MFVNDAINFLNDIKINLQRTKNIFQSEYEMITYFQDSLSVSSKNKQDLVS